MTAFSQKQLVVYFTTTISTLKTVESKQLLLNFIYFFKIIKNIKKWLESALFSEHNC